MQLFCLRGLQGTFYLSYLEFKHYAFTDYKDDQSIRELGIKMRLR